jgi:tetratricopeptide (TPR) repeat protein
MRRWFLLFLSALLLLTARSQTNGKDSVQHLSLSAKEDSNKVKRLLELSNDNKHSRPDSALLFARQALRLSRKLSFKRGEAMSLSSLALGYLYANNRPKALENYLKALKINEELNDVAGIAFSLHNIGLCYSDQQEYTLALTYLYKSKLINEQQHNMPYLLNNLLILGGCYEQMNRLDSALYYANKSYELASQLMDKEKMGMTARILGDIHAKMGQVGLAMEYYRLSLPLHKVVNNDYGISNSTLGMAKLFRQEGQKDSALYYARLSLSAASQGNFPQPMLNAASFLADYFQSIHQVDSAYAYLKVTMDIKDTLFSQEKVKSLQQLTFTEQERQQDLAVQKELDARQRKENLQLLVIAVVIPLFFLMVVLLSHSKAKLRSIEIMGRLSLLLLFEFIALLIHPYIANWTHHSPVWMLLILVAIGAVLVPLHHKLEHWVESLVLKREMTSLSTTKKGTVTMASRQMKSEEE